ncbi:hypothetical protein ORI89_19220, partial [Sphingobacterium sp. UT-1RO-CII-1]|uniref:hypothetical protein n=1 Tax=Sphingobacterium sp. UT-1RO-CII-1 TaxID=2995225 RepID=UPI00227D146A
TPYLLKEKETMDNKVIIEITPTGWTKKVVIGEKEYTENWKLTYLGGENKGDSLEEVEELTEELWEALNSDDPYEIARALGKENSNG